MAFGLGLLRNVWIGGRRGANPYSQPFGHADGDLLPHADILHHTNEILDRVADANGDADRNQNGDAHSDAHGNVDGNRDRHPFANAKPQSNLHSHRNSFANPDHNRVGNKHGDPDAHKHTNPQPHEHGNAYCHAHLRCNLGGDDGE